MMTLPHVKLKYGLQVFLSVFVYLIVTGQLQAQDLTADGEVHEINFTDDYEEFKIPDAGSLNGNVFIRFFVKGGDGGKRKNGFLLGKGGGGAKVSTSFEIGTFNGQLKPGSRIRFIVGQKGSSNSSDHIVGGGGGGGSAVIYTEASNDNGISCNTVSEDLEDAANCWVLLAVAGGGGGAYAHDLGANNGKKGRSQECGGDGHGTAPGSGGCNGNGGNSITNQAAASAGPGGGAKSNGSQSNGADKREGKKGGFTGGASGGGGANSGVNVKGGFGYGSGGAGTQSCFGACNAGGGGGGGYSGGGAGEFNAGGGGGSFANVQAILATKKDGGVDSTPDHGRATYQFTSNADGPIAKCKDIEVILNSNGAQSVTAAAFNDNSIAEPGESLTFLAGVSPLYVPFTSLSFNCSQVGEATVNLVAISTSGLVSECTAIVEVIDNTGPNANCRTSPILAEVSMSQHYTLYPDLVDQNSFDACGAVVEKYLDKTEFTCADLGSNTVTLTVEDNSGNQASCNYTFILTEDTETAIITCPDDVAVSILDGSIITCSNTINENKLEADFTGTCSSTITTLINDDMGNLLQTISGLPTDYAFAPGTYQVEYQLENNGLPKPSCTFSVTVDDGLDGDEKLICPQNIVVDLEAGDDCTVSIASNNLRSQASQCAHSITITGVYTAPDGTESTYSFAGGAATNQNFEVGVTTLTYTYTDIHGELTCDFTVTINDNIAPTALCKDINVQLDESCEIEIQTSAFDDGSSDNCSSIEVLRAGYEDCSSGFCFDIMPSATTTLSGIGTQTLDLIVVDESGNSTPCTAMVTLEDNIAPEALCQDITINLSNPGISAAAINNGSNDNCTAGNSLDLSLSFAESGASIPANYTLDCSHFPTVDIKLEVESINKSSCTATITVVDDIAPTAICQSVNVQLDANGNGTLSANEVNNGSSDNCSSGITEMTLSKETFSCSDLGNTSTILTVKDASGNMHTCTASVSVVDQVNPTAICEDITVELDDNGQASVQVEDLVVNAYDNCAIATAQASVEICIDGICLPFNVSSIDYLCNDIGLQEVNIVLSDMSLNTSTCTAMVTVEDKIRPQPQCLATTVQLGTDGTYTLLESDVMDTGTDNCGTVNFLGANPAVLDCSHLGTAVDVAVTVDDGHSNINFCVASITVEDHIALQPICLNPTVALNENGQYTLTEADVFGGGVDNCGTLHFEMVVPAQLDCSNMNAPVAVTITASDDSGNMNTCSALVTVADHISPSPQCKNTTVQLGVDGTYTLLETDVLNGGTDNCGGINFESVFPAILDCVHTGATVDVMVTVNDGYNNTGVCISTITVEDNMAPQPICLNKTVSLDENGQYTLTAFDVFGDGTDNCGILHFESAVPALVDCSNMDAPVTVTVTVSDDSGNTNTCTAMITVTESIRPVANCVDGLTVNLSDQEVTALDIENGGSYDNCTAYEDLEFLIRRDSPGGSYSSSLFLDCADIGTNRAFLRVIDEVGKNQVCFTFLTVIDDIAPEAACLNTTVEIQPDGPYQLQEADVYDAVNSYDECGVTQVSISASTYTCADVGMTFSEQVTISDAAGNTGQCIATIQVISGSAMPAGWSTTDIGVVTLGNAYAFDPCNTQYSVTGSGNNAVSSTTDNIAFASQTLCGDGAIIAKIESIESNGYGGLMIRETTDAESKQVAIFSNMTNILRHETRYFSNTNKVVQSFFRPNFYWLKLERQGDWIFAYSSFDGVNFQYVHGVYVPMQSCVEIGMVSFTYLPNAQTEAVFSNVSVSGNNGTLGIEEKHEGMVKTNQFVEEITTSPYHHITTSLSTRLFPNPANTHFNISLDQPLDKDTQVKIINLYGHVVGQQQLLAGDNYLSFDIQYLPTGTYWVYLLNNQDSIVVEKLLVSR